MHLNMSLVLTGSTHTQFTTLVSSARRRGISCLQATRCEHILGCTHTGCMGPDAGKVTCLSDNLSTAAAFIVDNEGEKEIQLGSCAKLHKMAIQDGVT